MLMRFLIAYNWKTQRYFLFKCVFNHFWTAAEFFFFFFCVVITQIVLICRIKSLLALLSADKLLSLMKRLINVIFIFLNTSFNFPIGAIPQTVCSPDFLFFLLLWMSQGRLPCITWSLGLCGAPSFCYHKVLNFVFICLPPTQTSSSSSLQAFGLVCVVQL